MENNQNPASQTPIPPPDIPVAEPVQPTKVFNLKVSNFLNSLGRQRKIAGGLLSILILAGAIGAGVYLTGQQQNTKTQAGSAVLGLSSSNSNPNPNDTFTVAVSLETKGLPVSAADLRINYDPTKLEATKVVAMGSLLPIVVKEGTIDASDPATGKIRIVLSGNYDSEGPHPGKGLGILAQITFKALSGGSASISFDNQTQVAALGQNSDAAGTKNSLTLTVGQNSVVNRPKLEAQPGSPPAVVPGISPSCNSFETAYLNSCNSAAKFTSTPIDPSCTTDSANVTLHISSADAKTVAIAVNVPYTSACGNIDDSLFASPVAYDPTYAITLPGGIGNKKVCVKLISTSGESSKCGGALYLSK